jgi:hypothetical protein
MLHSIPEKLEHVTISMETLLDLNTMSEAVGHLRAVEQRKKPTTPPVADANGRLLLTEEEWTARMKMKEKGGSSGSRGSCGRGCGKGKGRGGGRTSGAAGSNACDGCEESVGRDTCHNCGKTGHWAKDFHSKPRKGEAHSRGRGHGGGRTGGAAGSNSRDGCEESVGHDTCHNYGKTGHWVMDCRSKAKKGEAHKTLDDEPSLLLMEVGDLKFESESPLPPSPVTSPLPQLILAPPTLATKLVTQVSILAAC